MIQVPSHTCQRFVVGLLVSGLVLSTAVGTASADDLKDRRDQVRQAIVVAKRSIASGESDVASATTKLERSQTALAAAKRKLAAANGALGKARSADAAVAVRLKAAQSRLVRSEQQLSDATADVTRGTADVANQRRVIGEAVRSAYQQQTALAGYSIVLSSETTGDLAQRLQWSRTIMDTTSAEMGRLQELLDTLAALKVRLKERRDDLADAEASVAAEKAAAERQVALTSSLAASADKAKGSVAALVSKNAKLRAAAEEDLANDRSRYNKLRATDAKIGAEIRRRAEIARKKRLAEIARQKALAKKKKQKYVPAAESPKGFIRPVNASPGSPFGMRFHPILHYWRMHRGQDFGASCGAPLYAVADGRVASARWQGGFGNYTVIDVGFVNGRYVSVGYAHQSRMAVHAGQRVSQGQVIGYVGTTGLSTGCHLHFQVYVNGNVVNPMLYL